MVDTLGKCVSVTGNYDAAMDFRTGRASNNNDSATVGTNQALVFRASDAQYCEATDMECAKCRTSVFLEASSSPNALKTTMFCYGESGCVCIAACESIRWSEVVGGTKCPKAYTESKKEYRPVVDDGRPSGMQPWEITLVVIAVLLAVLIVVILVKRRRDDQMPGWIQTVIKKFHKKSSSTSAETTTTTTTTTTAAAGTTASGSGSESSGGENGGRNPKREGLSLFGWRVMREELIDNENHRLARVDNSDDRSPAAGFVQFADTAPSAPAFDDDTAPGHGNGPSAPPSAPPHDL